MFADDSEGTCWYLALVFQLKKRNMEITCFLLGKMNIGSGLCSEGFCALTTTADTNLQDVLCKRRAQSKYYRQIIYYFHSFFISRSIAKELADWLISNNVVEHIFGPNLHIEVCIQLLLFWYKHGALTCCCSKSFLTVFSLCRSSNSAKWFWIFLQLKGDLVLNI